MTAQTKFKEAENSGIKSKLKIKKAEEELEQIPLIKKVLGKTAKMASILNHLELGGDYMIHEGVEGTWIKAKNQDVFVAKNQKISEALLEQCGCDQL